MDADIIIIDDDRELGAMLSEFLAPDHFRVSACTTGEDGLARLQEQDFDLAILDIMLPGMNGIEVLKAIRRSSDIPVIMLTARGDDVDRILGLEFGADDYIAKPFNPRELLARIKAVLRRHGADDENEVYALGGITLNVATHRVMAGEQEVSLGPTEFRLLKFFITHPERVYSRAQLLDRVWGGNVYVEERTVDVHIRRLRKALEPSGCDRLVQTVRGAGYRFSGQVAG